MIFRPNAGIAVKLDRGTKVIVRTFDRSVQPIYGEVIKAIKNSAVEAHVILSDGKRFIAPLYLIEEV